jgi:hypothetical protein
MSPDTLWHILVYSLTLQLVKHFFSISCFAAFQTEGPYVAVVVFKALVFDVHSGG